MIIIDFFNFIYRRYDEVNNNTIIATLNYLASYHTISHKRIKVIFDGVVFKPLLPGSSYKNIDFCFALPNADLYIIKLLSSHSAKSFDVVTDDRELKNSIKKYAKNIFSTKDFWLKISVNNTYNKDNEKQCSHFSKTEKTTDYEDFDLDELMKKL